MKSQRLDLKSSLDLQNKNSTGTKKKNIIDEKQKTRLHKGKSLPNISVASSLKEDNKKVKRVPKNPEVRQPKAKILKQLQIQLHQKVQMDQFVKIKLLEQESKRVQQQRKIQQQLQSINQQNLRWIDKMAEFTRELESKKKKILLSSESIEEQKLISQYKKILEDEENIKMTKLYRQMVQKEDWKQINREKQKITSLLRQNTKKLASIARSQRHQLPKNKIPDQNIDQKKLEPVDRKVIRKSKNVQELKDLGRQYLQHAKKIEKSKSQKKLLKVDNKNIDYPIDVKQLIKLKVDDLSKKPQLGFGSTILSKRKRNMKNTLISTGSLHATNNQSGFQLIQNNSKRNK